MQPRPANLEARAVGVLLRGEPEPLRAWLERAQARRLGFCVAVIFLGAGLYGAAMGWWRDPRQALYTALKFPLIILLTTTGNALLNAMLAPLLGLNLSLRQSFLAILMSFTIASAILGSFSPLAAFVIWNTPPLSANAEVSGATYGLIQLAHVGVIAFAGVAANVRLVRLLRSLSGSAPAAWRVLAAWLAGNLFLGSQLCWLLRPFIGSPGLPVQFLRPTAFQGNFYEAVLGALRHLLHFN
ncbi:MAG: hypothetical protein ABSF95_07695 [Verrucomicrobiota bacterium]